MQYKEDDLADELATTISKTVEQRFATQISVPEELHGLEALVRMHTRSVCRNYEERPLDDELVKLLCATALTAPSKSDLQQATLIRVTAPELREEIYKVMPNSPWIRTAPEFLVVCGDHSRLQHLFTSRQSEFPNNHLDSFFNAAVDAGILLATLVQAANFAGLGSCPVSEIRDHVDTISSLLELPKWVFPVAGLTLGYTAAFEPLTPRLGLAATIQDNIYNSATTRAEIEGYDARRIHQRPYAEQRETDRFGQSDTYGWSEDKFRQYSSVQRSDFGAYVRRQGYKLD